MLRVWLLRGNLLWLLRVDVTGSSYGNSRPFPDIEPVVHRSANRALADLLNFVEKQYSVLVSLQLCISAARAK